MANGLLGGLPPGLRGMLAAEQMGQQRTQNQLGQLGGILSLQNVMAQQQEMQKSAPLRQARMEAELRNLTNPAPKWQVSERFNEQTGKKEKVLVDLNNPSNIVPFGGQEARNLSFQNTGPEIVGVDPTTGQRVTSLATAATPHQAWQQTTQFPWQQQVDRANVANSSANVGIANANLFYNTGMGPLGGGGSLPRPLGTIPQPLPGMGGSAPAPAAAPRPAPAQPPLGVPPPRNAAPAAPQVIVPEGTAMTPAAAPTAPQLPPREAAQQSVKDREKQAEYQKVMQTYMSARDGLLEGLQSASTGPFVGLVPPVRTEEQIAQGGVAAMAPVLKAIFRVAGEGNFTDRDQALLMDMVPTRTDTPEARIAKVRNIDRIISSKLGMEIPENLGASVRALGVPYEPEKYEYRIEGNKVQRKAK